MTGLGDLTGRGLGDRGRAAIETLAVVGTFTLLTLVMTYPVVRHMSSALPNDLGDPLLNTWILAWDADRMLHGLRDLWQAPFFYPFANTLAFSEHLLGIALLVAPVQWLSGNPLLAYNVAFLFSYVLAGCGMYLLVRSLTGSRAAAAVAGTIFAFVPYRVAHLPHLQVLTSGWMPIALWALHRYFATGRRRMLLAFGVSFTLQGLSNGYYLFYFGIATAIVVLDGLLRTSRPRGRLLAELAACALLVSAVFAPVAWAYQEAREDQGLVRSRGEMLAYSPDLTAYLHVPPNLWLWGGLLRQGEPEAELFAGATVMALAAVALVTNWRRSSPDRPPLARSVVTLYFVVGLVALLLSLGPVPRFRDAPLVESGPYQWLIAVVPGLDGLRVPARFAMVVYLAASVLSGVAVARLLSSRTGFASAVLASVLSAAILAEGYRGPLRAVVLADRVNPGDEAPYAWLARRPPGGVLELPMEGREAMPTHALLFQYRALQHKHPIVNGFSGYTSPLVNLFTDSASPVVDLPQARDFLRGLRSIGVRFVTVHPGQFRNRAFGKETLAALSGQADQIEDRYASETMTVLQLRPLDPPVRWGDDRLREIPFEEVAVSASHSEERLPMAFDGDSDTRWLTGIRQSGDEWIDLQFGRPRRVARVRFEIASRSQGDYPRRLRVELSPDGRQFDKVAWEDAVLPELLGGVVRSRGLLSVDIDLGGAPVSALRLRQTGETEVWFWSIDEMSLWELVAE